MGFSLHRRIRRLCHNLRPLHRRRQGGRVLHGLKGVCRSLGRHQPQELGAGHLAQHAGRHGVGPVVVVDVDVQTVHHIEVWIGKQFFHGGIAHLGAHPPLHEGLEIGAGRQGLRIFQRRQRGLDGGLPGGGLGQVHGRRRAGHCVSRLLRWGCGRFRDRPFLTRPAAEETFAHAPPSCCPPLRLFSVLMLTGWPKRSVRR